jgi:hypothetical protein
VIVSSIDPPRELLAVGCLAEPFSIRLSDDSAEIDLDSLRPGDEYPGPTEPTGGKYKLGQKRGGVIERRTSSGRQFALTSGSGNPDLDRNARIVLSAWKTVSSTGMPFVINEVEDAIYWDGGSPRFLSRVPGGFAWPASHDAPND